jgi:hypothetical protein
MRRYHNRRKTVRERTQERNNIERKKEVERLIAITSQTSLPTDAAVRARIPVSDRMSALLWVLWVSNSLTSLLAPNDKSLQTTLRVRVIRESVCGV